MKNKLYRASIPLPNGKRKWIRSVSQEGLEKKKQELLTRIGAGRFVNDVLQIRKRKENSFGRHPVEWSHGERVIVTLPDSKLFGKVIEGIKGVAGIEFLVVFSVAAFYFSVVTRRKRLDFLVADSKLGQRLFKERQRLLLAVAHLVGKFKTIVCLDALDRKGELFHDMLQKLCGRVCTVFFECLEITESAVFVNERILIVFLPGSFSHKAGRRNIFHINLSPLPGIFHLFIWFWNVFGVGEFYGFPVNAVQELAQSGDGFGIPVLAQLYPEYHKTRVRIPAAHILDQLDLSVCVLVWVTVRAM